MTGISPSTSRIYNNGWDCWRISPALASAVPLPDHFHAKGYTAYGRGGGKLFHRLSWIVGDFTGFRFLDSDLGWLADHFRRSIARRERPRTNPLS
jgi:hypothetical protein